MNNDAQENVFKCLEDISDRERKSKSRRWERSAWKIGREVQMLSLGHTHIRTSLLHFWKIQNSLPC